MEEPELPQINHALRSLPLFNETYLFMQATNIAIVDSYLESLELSLLRELIDKEKTPENTMFVFAITQLWFFGFYELLRTWRQWVKDIEKYAASPEKSAHGAAADLGIGDDFYVESFKLAKADPSFLVDIKKADELISPFFRDLETIRITLAKHEVPKTKGIRADGAGYGRIDSQTGSMLLIIELKDGSSRIFTRRGLSDDFKLLFLSDESAA